MDLITHVLVTYLVTLGVVGFQPQYVAAGALAGGLPDADALLFPLARRWPIFGHRGITHSFLGIAIIAIGGAFLAPLVLPGSALIYFAVFLLGGLCHIGLDAFTNYSVPPLVPFDARRISFNAERAVNLSMTVFSVASFYLLLGVERNQVAISIYWTTIYALSGFFFAYFGLRLALRLSLGRRKGRLGGFQDVLPTENPFVWHLFAEERTEGRLVARFGRYVAGRGLIGPYTLDVATTHTPEETGPIPDAATALDRSFPFLQGRGRFYDDSLMFARTDRTLDGGWLVRWYSVEFGVLGRWATIEVAFPPDGARPRVARHFRRVPMPWVPPNATR
ncbi:MAG: metal-dependent hydrolase [Thermoplasmata archaeon]